MNGKASRIFEYFKVKSFKSVDLCMVANKGQEIDAKRYSDNVMIVPDPVPEFSSFGLRVRGRESIVFVCSFDRDEPVSEILEAAIELSEDKDVYVTGRVDREVPEECRSKVTMTGFLPDRDYIALIQNADCIISCTTEEGCLQSSGYEAMAVEVPFVTSSTKALREYFKNSAVYVENSKCGILKGVSHALEKRESLTEKLKFLKNQKNREAEIKLNRLSDLVENFLLGIS